MNATTRFGILVLAGLLLAGPAMAAPIPWSTIQYNPNGYTAQGVLAPNGGTYPNDSYPLLITGPSAASATNPITVTLGLSVLPGTPAAAVGYISANPSTLTFNQTGQVITVTITVLVPEGSAAGNYGWRIKPLSWPDAAKVTIDNGATVNGLASDPPVNPSPPVITPATLSPVDGASFIYTTTPVSFPIHFDATASGTAAGTAISGLQATFDGRQFNGSDLYKGVPMPVLGVSGVQTLAASGSVMSPGITDTGPHTIVVSATNGFGTATATMRINILAPPKITNTNNPTFTYGQSGNFAVTATGWPAPTFTATNLPSWATLNPTTGVISGTPTGAGTFTFSITATNSVGADTHPFTLTVNPAPLTVTATAASKTYGANDPAFTYSLTNGTLVGNDRFSGALSRDSGENVGIYAISQGTLTAGSNYVITYNGANFSVTAKALTVTAAAKSKTYGENDPALTYTFSGLVHGDTSSVFAGMLARAAGENVDTYAINQGSLTAGANYAITYHGANFTITAKALTVTAAAKSKTYGENDPALTYALTNGTLVGSDAFSGALARATGENVGSYAINRGTLTAGSNYTITYNGANFTITAKALTVTATSGLAKVYGASDPTLTYSLTNGTLVGNDAFTGALARATGQNVGTYAINQGTLSAGSNYTIAFNGENFTITAKPLAVTATATSKTYGAADPAFNYSFSPALVGTDSFSGGLTRDAGENIGTYAINQGTLSAGNNYAINYTSALLTISKATPIVTWATPAPITSGTALSSTQLNATASVAGSFDYAPAAGTVLPAGTQNLSVTFTPTDTTNYTSPVTKTVSLTVNADSPAPTCGTAIVRHAPTLNGNSGVHGSLQVLFQDPSGRVLPENIALNGNAWISENLYVPGTPTVRLNGHPSNGSPVIGSGSATPSNYTVTLNGNALVGHLVTRTNPVAMPVVPLPPSWTGTRDVRINRTSDIPGSFSSPVRDLTVNGDVGPVVVPPGNYRDITVTGNCSLIFGFTGSTYNVRNLRFSGNSTLEIVGPVTLNVAEDATFNDDVGNSEHPDWLKLNLFNGDLTLDGTVSFHGHVLAPLGEVRINGQGKLHGGLSCDKLTMNGYGLLDVGCPNP